MYCYVFKQKWWVCKPDSVPFRASVICLMQPTPRHGRATLIAGVHGLAGGGPYSRYVAATSRGLLPHIFTLAF